MLIILQANKVKFGTKINLNSEMGEALSNVVWGNSAEFASETGEILFHISAFVMPD